MRCSWKLILVSENLMCLENKVFLSPGKLELFWGICYCPWNIGLAWWVYCTNVWKTRAVFRTPFICCWETGAVRTTTQPCWFSKSGASPMKRTVILEKSSRRLLLMCGTTTWIFILLRQRVILLFRLFDCKGKT